jgi:hypothetical protein
MATHGGRDVTAPSENATQVRPPRSRTGRDYRLDFFRGLALLFIFIDHIPDNVVSYFTLRSFAFCDAAEVFIFISGYTAALAYAPTFSRESTGMGIARIYRRVWQLYIAHLCLFMIFNAEVAYTLKFLDNPLFADELQIGDYLNNPGEAFIRVLLLQFQPSLLNILPLYIVLLLGLPWVILIIRHNVWFAFGPSAALWLAANLFRLNVPGFPEGQFWYFNPLAWQFLFITAACFGFFRAEGHEHARPPRWLRIAAIGFVAVAAAISASWSLHDALPRVPQFVAFLPDTWFDKTMLPPARLVSIMALALVVTSYCPRDAGFLTSRVGWIVILCGQNSLEVFCLSILLAVMANFVLSLLGYGLAVQIVINLCGLAIMAGLGMLLAWFRAGGHLPAAPRASAAE